MPCVVTEDEFYRVSSELDWWQNISIRCVYGNHESEFYRVSSELGIGDRIFLYAVYTVVTSVSFTESSLQNMNLWDGYCHGEWTFTKLWTCDILWIVLSQGVYVDSNRLFFLLLQRLKGEITKLNQTMETLTKSSVESSMNERHYELCITSIVRL